MKYLISIIQLKKTDYDVKITEIEKKVTGHNHDKYITHPVSNTLAAIFNASLAQANLITKTYFLMLNCQVFIENVPQINENICLLKINLKSQKYLIAVISLAKINLKKLAHKNIQYYNQ